jgi:hypothetical protein
VISHALPTRTIAFELPSRSIAFGLPNREFNYTLNGRAVGFGLQKRIHQGWYAPTGVFDQTVFDIARFE